MGGTNKVPISYLVFTLTLIGDFIVVNGQHFYSASSYLNGPGRIFDRITPIRNLPFQSPYPYQNQNLYGYPTAYRASADLVPSCTCHLCNRNSDLPPLLKAFERNPSGQIYGNNQPCLRESEPSVEMGYFDYTG